MNSELRHHRPIKSASQHCTPKLPSPHAITATRILEPIDIEPPGMLPLQIGDNKPDLDVYQVAELARRSEPEDPEVEEATGMQFAESVGRGWLTPGVMQVADGQRATAEQCEAARKINDNIDRLLGDRND